MRQRGRTREGCRGASRRETELTRLLPKHERFVAKDGSADAVARERRKAAAANVGFENGDWAALEWTVRGGEKKNWYCALSRIGTGEESKEGTLDSQKR